MAMMTTAEAAERWGCTRQWVLRLISAKRIKGAYQRSNNKVWMIPEGTVRPDARKPGPKPAKRGRKAK